MAKEQQTLWLLERCQLAMEESMRAQQRGLYLPTDWTHMIDAIRELLKKQ